MEFDQELEYELDYTYGDEEITERYLTDEEDYNWPNFCQVCGFAALDCVCERDDECRTCGGDIVDCACTLERRRQHEERLLERP